MGSRFVLMIGALLALGSGACNEGSGRDPGCDPACGAGELCVMFYDGQCNLMGRGQCVATSCGLQCDTPGGGASGPCNTELCNGGAVQDGGNVQFVCGHPCGTEPPDTFRKLSQSVDEMNRVQSERYVAMIRRAGLSYRDALTDYYRKYSFACTPFIVAFIASGLGSAFKKNILLMSLLSSLVISVVYYVAQMVTGILAKNGVVPPLFGAWAPFALYLVLGSMMFRTART